MSILNEFIEYCAKLENDVTQFTQYADFQYTMRIGYNYRSMQLYNSQNARLASIMMFKNTEMEDDEKPIKTYNRSFGDSFSIDYSYPFPVTDTIFYSTTYPDGFEVDYSSEENIFQQSLIHDFDSTGADTVIKIHKSLYFDLELYNYDLFNLAVRGERISEFCETMKI